jgi:predicted phage-related endonuclease
MSTIVVPAPTPQELWQRERQTFIGGSEVHELFNIPQYGKGCARALAYRKRGEPTEVDDSPDDALMRRGNIMEPLAAALYEEQTGRKVRKPALNEHGLPKIQRHKDYPFLGVHTDRFILAGHGGVKETGDLEIKSHDQGPFLNMLREGIKPGYSLQVQHSNLVTGHSWGGFAAIGVFGGLPLKNFDTVADPKIHDEIKRRGEALWNGLEKNELPDQLEDENDMRCQNCAYRMTCRGEEISEMAQAFFKAQAKSDKNLVQIDDAELTQDVAAFKIIKEEIHALTNTSEKSPGAIEMLEAKIKSRLLELGIKPGADSPVFPGIGKFTLNYTSWSGVDQQKLKKDFPEVYDKVYVKGRVSDNLSMRLWPFKI